MWDFMSNLLLQQFLNVAMTMQNIQRVWTALLRACMRAFVCGIAIVQPSLEGSVTAVTGTITGFHCGKQNSAERVTITGGQGAVRTDITVY